MSLRSFIHHLAGQTNRFVPRIPLVAQVLRQRTYWPGLLSLSVSLTCLGVSSDALATMQYGDQNNDVYTLQGRLVELGYSTGGVDGFYGDATEAAVYQYQVDQGLYYVDGIAGPETLSSLGLAYLLGTGGTSSYYPETSSYYSRSYGSISSECGYSSGYIVAIPGAEPSEVRRYANSVCQDYSDRGSFVNAGAYDSYSIANREADRLREVGLDARVIHRDRD